MNQTIVTEKAGQESSLSRYKILGHPVMIGDIFKRLYRSAHHADDIYDIFHRIWNLWGRCDFTKSLNQIVYDSEFEKVSLCKQCLDNEKEDVKYNCNH